MKLQNLTELLPHGPLSIEDARRHLAPAIGAAATEQFDQLIGAAVAAGALLRLCGGTAVAKVVAGRS